MRRFRTGKIPSDILIRSVFRYAGTKDRRVLLGPSIGEDAALVSLDDQVLVLSTDPVTGAESDIGWLSVHLNANDVACRGAKPRWFLCTLLLPEKSNVGVVERIMKQIDKAAKELGVAVVGGHTEVTPDLSRPIVIGYMTGTVPKDKFVTSRGGRPGDHLIMTKAVGIEGTAVLAADFSETLTSKAGARLIQQAKGLRRLISVVDDALIAVRAGGVRAMHDPTEGGLLNGTWELAEASRVGFLIHESKIAIRRETLEICSLMQVDPLKLLSSGCLLIAADTRKSGFILRGLSAHGIPAKIIGKLTPRRSGRKLVRVNGSIEEIGPSERDEIYRVIESHRS